MNLLAETPAMEPKEIQFSRIGKVFLIGRYNSTVSANGWTDFVIRKEGTKGFRAGYSIVEHRFSRGSDFMKLDEETRNEALAYAHSLFHCHTAPP